MTKLKTYSRGAFFVLLAVLLLASVLPVSAFQGEGPLKKEVELVLNKTYEVFIGNGGVYIDNSRHIGTLVVKAEEFPDNRASWHQFTQRLIDIRVYKKNGAPFDTVFGLVRVYFNLDKFQYDKWLDDESNMSIWYFDELAGGWRKCTTHWEPVAGLQKGRLWCLVHHYTRYGLAWTKPTLIMKLIKAGIITVTPTP